MRGTFAALQLFAAFFLAIFGLALAFNSNSAQGPILVGAALAAVGLMFLALLAVNIRKPK
ncbi:MAG TPA: hypothetical protein VGJ33_12535 [Candidatus Angelobacter sp.]